MAQLQVSTGEKTLSPPRTTVVHGWITAELAAEIERESQRRGLHRDELVARLIESIFDDVQAPVIVDELLHRLDR